MALLRELCAYVYPRCPEGSVSNNSMTWVASGVPNTSLPFQRPCLIVCRSVQQSCYGNLINSFADIGPLMRTLANCTSISNYSVWETENQVTTAMNSLGGGGVPLNITVLPTYDGSNNVAQCNLPTAQPAIARGSEEYLYNSNVKGACQGIVSNFYTEGGSRTVASLNSITFLMPSQPLLAAPFSAQNTKEAALHTLLRTLPAWLSSQCYVSMRKYLCSSYMLAPEPHNMTVYRDMSTGFTFIIPEYNVGQSKLFLLYTDAVAIASYMVYLPSYPHRDVCIDYANKFGTFLNTWRSNDTLLTPRCTATVTNEVSGNTVELFPTQRQAMIYVLQRSSSYSNTNATIVSTNITSNSNTLANSLAIEALESMWSTRCPRVFVVPEDPSNQLNK
jgi:hypothetical protein